MDCLSQETSKFRIKSRESNNYSRNLQRELIIKEKRNLSNDTEVQQFISLNEIKKIGEKIKKNKCSLEILAKINQIAFQGDEFISSFIAVEGALNALISLLGSRNSRLQEKCLMCLVNLSTGKHKTCRIIEKASSCYLITFLNCSNSQLQELCCWVLGNISADCKSCRDSLSSHGFISALMPLLSSSYENVQKCALFALSQFYSHDGLSEKDVDEFFRNQWISPGDKFEEFSYELSRIFAHLSCFYFQKCIENKFFLHFLHHNLQNIIYSDGDDLCDHKALTLTVRILGNMAYHINDASVLQIYQTCDFKNGMLRLLNLSHVHLVKEICWLLLNLSAWSDEIIQEHFCSYYIPFIISQVSTHHFSLFSEILQILWNCLHHLKSQVAKSVFISEEVLERVLFCLHLNSDIKSEDAIHTIKLGITLMYKITLLTSADEMCTKIRSLKNHTIFKDLLNHPNRTISSYACKIDCLLKL